MFEGATVAVFDGRCGECAAWPVPVERAAVLGAVKDKPCRARLRASLTAPARDASSAAQAGTRKRPPSRTRKQANPDCGGRTREVGWMKGRPLRGRAFPFPFPGAVERWGTGTGNGTPISGL